VVFLPITSVYIKMAFFIVFYRKLSGYKHFTNSKLSQETRQVII